MPAASNDTDEVRRYFDAEASHWDSDYAVGGSRQPRVQRFTDAVSARVPSGARVLDLGCGSGRIAIALAEAGYRVTGADISPQMLEVCRQTHGDDAVEWVLLEKGEGSRLPFEDGQFEVVVASSVFEYLGDPAAAFSDVARVLSPGGWGLITVPDPRHPVRVRETRRRRVIAVAPIRWILERSPLASYVKYLRLSINHFDLIHWLELMRNAGFEVEAAPDCSDELAMLQARMPCP